MPDSTSRKQLTHDRILDVASRAIRRAGYGGVGVAKLMKEAGLTHGGFYAHFVSRKALLAATMVGSLQLARTLQGKGGKAWLANARAPLIQQYETSRAG